MTNTNTTSNKVPFDDILPGKYPNCRRTAGRFAELVDSIAQHGLHVPLLVKLVTEEGHSKYALVDGRRRYAAIQKIRETDPKAFDPVPVTWFVGNEDDALVAMYTTNAERDGHTPIELADYLKLMLDRGHKLKDLAKKINISASRASQVTKVRNKCIHAVLQAVDEGKIPFSLAMEWSIIPEEKQARVLIRYLERLEKASVGEKGAKKEAAKAVGVVRRMGVKPLIQLWELAVVQSVSDYQKGVADGLAIALQKKEPGKELVDALAAQKECGVVLKLKVKPIVAESTPPPTGKKRGRPKKLQT